MTISNKKLASSMNDRVFLDIGNTNTKWKYKASYYETPSLNFSEVEFPYSSEIWVSNVSSKLILNKGNNLHIVHSQASYKGLINSYKNPESLGSDRWLAMIAAFENNPLKAFIVLDIGTAITFDYVNNIGSHQGGLIFPGLVKIRNTFDQFQITKGVDIDELGQSTKEAWSKGTLSLIVTTINEKIRAIKQFDPQVKIFATGGGLSEIEKHFDFTYNFHKNLVLDGLELFANNVG